ncbi:hypothetical protein TVAGG3_0310120, partial [Trichomonas vaginalis G3]
QFHLCSLYTKYLSKTLQVKLETKVLTQVQEQILL